METINSNDIDHSSYEHAVPATKLQQRLKVPNAKDEVSYPLLHVWLSNGGPSVEIVLAAAEGGADIIELGMPFSDPLADGATIQHAGHIALERGMTISGCMEIARQVSAQHRCATDLDGLL